MGAVESFLPFDIIHVDHNPLTSLKLLLLLIAANAIISVVHRLLLALSLCALVCVFRRRLISFFSEVESLTDFFFFFFLVQHLIDMVGHVAPVALRCAFMGQFVIYWKL